MSGMFWIALELSIPKIGFNIMLSLPVKKLDAFKFDGVVESDNTGLRPCAPNVTCTAQAFYGFFRGALTPVILRWRPRLKNLFRICVRLRIFMWISMNL